MEANQDRALISAFIITFNEEDHIAACIGSVSFCDEILVIDSFSTDRTVEIARSLGATVIQRAWPGYRDQKALGLATVKHEWVLNVDADERVTPTLRESILALLRDARARSLRGEEEPFNGYKLNRCVYFLGQWWRRGGWYPEHRLRLMRKSKGKWGGKQTHERPSVEGKVGLMEGELEHYPFDNMEEMYARLNVLSSGMAKEDFDEGRRTTVPKLLFSPLFRFIKFYILRRGFREGVPGLVVALNEVCYTYTKYAKLWALRYEEELKRRGVKDPRFGADADAPAAGEAEAPSVSRSAVG